MGYFLNVMQRIPMCILGKTVIYYDVVEEKEIEEENYLLEKKEDFIKDMMNFT